MGTYLSVQNEHSAADATVSYGGNTAVNNRYAGGDVPTGSSYPLPEASLDSFKTPSDSESFGMIVRSGRVKMTDYTHYKKETTYPLVYIPHLVANRAGIISGYDSGSKTWSVNIRDETTGRYDEVTDYFRLQAAGVTHKTAFVQGNLKQTVMGMVISDAASTLDLLTEFAERKETINLVLRLLASVKRPLQSFKDAADYIRSTKNAADAASGIADLWLTYRYAISPLVYSIQDALEVLDEQDRTFMRSGSRLKGYGIFPDPEINCLYDTGSINVEWRATSKARFSSSSLGAANMLGANPLRTAWELTHYSFLIDWFINIGQLIESYTFSTFDLADERKFCVSTKTTSRIDTYYWRRGSGVPATNVIDSFGNVAQQWDAIDGIEVTQLAKTYNEESYVREVFDPDELEFDLSPYLDWRRWLDLTALLAKDLTNSLRRLR